MKKQNAIGIFIVFLVVVLSSCGKRNDLSASDFPLIDEGLSESQLIEQVGNPHEKLSNSLDIMSIQASLLTQSLSNGMPVLDFEKSWNAVTGGDPEKCYVYKLSDKNRAMIAFIKDKQVIMITRAAVNYED